ncbi:MAG: hypothetical protein F4134_10730 [Acidimicrobiaceae bacterium]|nr:hypothetical protein [Acidimicrobiaceae bacterium]MYK65329.1 hypothetical protein [Gemmatimonadota bacterium]
MRRLRVERSSAAGTQSEEQVQHTEGIAPQQMPEQHPNPNHYVQTINSVCAELGGDPERRLTINTVERRLYGLANDMPEDATLRALAEACAYRSRPEGHDSPFACGPYAPMIPPQEDGGPSYPAPLNEVEDEVLLAWAEFARDDSLHPLVRARLADLLWARRHGSPQEWFTTAVKSYVDLEATDVGVLELVDGLSRAVDICKESSHLDLRVGPLEVLSRLARDTLDTDDGPYGVVVRAVRTLADNDHPCTDLIDDAIAQYGDVPFRVADLCEIAIRATSDQNQKRRLNLQRVHAFRDAAERSSGLLRVNHLQAARAIADKAQLTEEVHQIAAMIENTDMEGEWHTFETDIPLDRDAMRSEVDSVVGNDDLLSALLRFAQRVPTGDPEETASVLAVLASQSVIHALATKMVFGPENIVTQITSGDPLRSYVDRGEYDAQAIGLFSVTSGRFVLDALHERYEPDTEMIADCFTSTAVPPDLARRIAVSYQHWRNSDPISAVSVIVLTIEPIVRRICRAVGIHITEARPRRTGETPIGSVRSLGPLIEDLEVHIGPMFTRYLQASLVDRWSTNLRGLLCHGLEEELTEAQYAILFHVACVLRLISAALSPPDPTLQDR